MKKALICGAGGFIGSHLVKRLKEKGYWIRGVDLKYPDFSKTDADAFIIWNDAVNCAHFDLLASSHEFFIIIDGVSYAPVVVRQFFKGSAHSHEP